MSQSKKLRHYQEELVDPGLRGYNYIICAPTGSGKTLAAADLCHRRMTTMERDLGKRFKAIFIVPTRHLKGQQRDAFWDVFDARAATAVTKTQAFRRTFDDPSVKVVMITAQILVNALENRRVTFRELSLLVFDECHHTTLNHPYNEIMKEYMREKKRLIEADPKKRGSWLVGLPFGGLPQIVGLTASLGTGGETDAVRHIVNLCANLDCSGVKTVSDAANLKELESYNNLPEKDAISSTHRRPPCQISSGFVKILKEIMYHIEQKHMKTSRTWTSSGNASRPYGTLDYESWAGSLRAQAQEKGNPGQYAVFSYLLKLNLALMTYQDLPAKYVLHALDTFQELEGVDLDSVPSGKACRDEYEKRCKELRQLAEREDPLSIPKLKRLVELLKDTFESKPNSRGIVLAQTRFSTLALLDFVLGLVRDDPSCRGIRPTRIVGQGKEVEDAQTPRGQEDALREFKTGKANLLIATDIVQEGLDVPACNFIVRYNFVSNEIGTVQSKGRARAQNSRCFLIVEKGSRNETREHRNRKRLTDMDDAIHSINRKTKEDWLGLVGEKQIALLTAMEKQEKLDARANPSPIPTSHH